MDCTFGSLGFYFGFYHVIELLFVGCTAYLVGLSSQNPETFKSYQLCIRHLVMNIMVSIRRIMYL
jgi:hypothetical protein